MTTAEPSVATARPPIVVSSATPPPKAARWFGPEDRPLFGWMHEAAGTKPSAVGVVVCSPFGYEGICTHRSLRHFCEAFARAGVPALRFDYDGTGDSAGDDRDPKRLEAWVASVGQAIDHMRRAANVERVVLLGVRFGALVALLASAERTDVDGVIAIAPVLVGKAWLRELRAREGAMEQAEPPPEVVIDESVQGSLGFTMTTETLEAIRLVDLNKLDPSRIPSLLLIERSDAPGPDAWPVRLVAAGVHVDRRTLPGYVEMTLGPAEAEVPDEMIRAATEWTTARAGGTSPHPARVEPVTTRARVAAPDAGRVSPVIESVETIDGRLFGVLSNPASAPARRRAILLLNAGSQHHVGPGRIHVTLARRWAALGHAVLRLDIAGIGDSPCRAGDAENVVYPTRATDDVAAAVTFLRRQPGVEEVHALGLCSGGYHAFKAAVRGAPLDGVVLINPLTFFYEPGQEIGGGGSHVVASEASRYGRRLRSLDGWKTLLRGGVHWGAVANVIARRSKKLARDTARDVARRVGVSIGDDLARELGSVAKKNVALRFVFASSDPGLALLEEEGGATVARLQKRGRLSIARIEGADHTFTPLWSQPLLIEKLAAFFDGAPPARGARGA